MPPRTAIVNRRGSRLLTLLAPLLKSEREPGAEFTRLCKLQHLRLLRAFKLARTSALSLVFSRLVFGLANKNYGSVAGKTDDAVGETVSLTSWRADWEA